MREKKGRGSRVMEMFCILVAVTQIYACIKTQRTIYQDSKVNIKIK